MIKIEGENCIKIENLLESIAAFLHISKKEALSAFVNACTAPEVLAALERELIRRAGV